jgi:hypothetical protein
MSLVGGWVAPARDLHRVWGLVFIGQICWLRSISLDLFAQYIKQNTIVLYRPNNGIYDVICIDSFI